MVRSRRLPPAPDPRPDVHVLIVGAGFSGIGAAIKLREAGFEDLVIVEQADDLGGTWRDNRYPGCAVDITSFVYSYSFEPRPDWSRVFAPHTELKAYADHVADKYDVRRRIRFGTRVVRAVFDEAGARWRVETADGGSLTARFLVMASGGLTQPKPPRIPGLRDFAGFTMHTARWDDTHDLRGRRVGLIGTGATAVQLVPAIAPAVARLDVYQRTPIWVLPKPDAEIPPWMRAIFRAAPWVQRGVRLGLYTVTEAIMMIAAIYNRQLPWLTRFLQAQCAANLRRQVASPELRARLTPRYDFGCKRPSFSNDYWASFTRQNVELVTDPIARITPAGIVTADGRARAIDTLILATGFKVFERGNIPPFDIVGTGGLELGDFWERQRLQAYEGITVPRFPNLFMMLGPYSFIGTSFFATMEGHAAHLVRCLRHARRRGARTVEVREAANDAYFREIQRRQRSTVFFNADCRASNSYYFDAHGDAPLLRPSTTVELMWRSRTFPLSHYRFA